MIEDLERLALKAGAAIRAVFEKNDYKVQTKSDQSPLTEADLLAHSIIVQGLKDLGDYPYISEEEEPKVYENAPQRYWLIDPLDGTKEFVAGRKSFTVNIALIEDGVPVLAVVYAPMLEELYAASYGVYRENGQAKRPVWKKGHILLSSHSHPEPQLVSFMERNKPSEHIRVGSSIKFCWVASGRAHSYPRFAPLHVWDTAAGDGVARAAGCKIVDWQTGLPPKYEYNNLWTPAFSLSAPEMTIS